MLITKVLVNEILKTLENRKEFKTILKRIELEGYEKEETRYKNYYKLFDDLVQVLEEILSKEENIQSYFLNSKVCKICGRRMVSSDGSICLICKGKKDEEN